jgi:hypothetical protein
MSVPVPDGINLSPDSVDWIRTLPDKTLQELLDRLQDQNSYQVLRDDEMER